MMTTGAQTVYQRPESLTAVTTHYCPGCTHGVAHRLVAEVIDEIAGVDRIRAVSHLDTAAET